MSPLFLEFLMGKRNYDCTPWGSPAYNIFGWQKPCYLLQDGYASTFKELMETTKCGKSYGTASGNPKVRQLHGELWVRAFRGERHVRLLARVLRRYGKGVACSTATPDRGARDLLNAPQFGGSCDQPLVQIAEPAKMEETRV